MQLSCLPLDAFKYLKHPLKLWGPIIFFLFTFSFTFFISKAILMVVDMIATTLCVLPQICYKKFKLATVK